jgi:peroxiredoxin
MKWLAVAATLGLAGGIAIAWLTRPQIEPAGVGVAPAAQIGDRRPAFRHAATDGRIIEASDFDGRWLLLNFWATWCAPCVREMPVLQAVDEEYRDLAVVGIAVDEPGSIQSFVDRLGVTYPILVGTSDIRETRDRYGNPEGLLPYTVLIDRRGTIRWRHLGELDRTEIEKALDQVRFERP